MKRFSDRRPIPDDTDRGGIDLMGDVIVCKEGITESSYVAHKIDCLCLAIFMLTDPTCL